MNIFNRSLSVGLEEDTSGKAGSEIEHTFYARLTNQGQLNLAVSKEFQEQWTVFIPKSDSVPGEGSIRVRMSQYEGADPTYTLATKIRKNDMGDKIETTMSITEDLFKTVKFLSSEGMIKDRFRFKVPDSDLVWEVDMFPNGEGGYFEWCKIDLEVEQRGVPIPELPISFDEVIFPKDLGERTEEERAKDEATKAELFKKFFIAKNVYLKGGETPTVGDDGSQSGGETSDAQVAVSSIPELDDDEPGATIGDGGEDENPNSADTGVEPENN